MYAAILMIINNDAKLQQSPYNDGIYVCEIDSKEEEVGKGKEANINQSNTGSQFWKQRLRWMDGSFAGNCIITATTQKKTKTNIHRQNTTHNMQDMLNSVPIRSTKY